MNRVFALLFALILATISVSSACTAAPGDLIHFTLQPERNNRGEIHATFAESRNNDWSSGFMPSDLIGLDMSGFRADGTRRLSFAVVREAGRLDCTGSGGKSHAAGDCSFTPDAAFNQLLASRGIGRPTREQSLGLMALNVRRDLVEAVAAAHYPAPTIDQLLGLTAVGADGNYVRGMAQAGYRPQSVQSLVEFKAIGITPDWIGSYARAGYAHLPADELVQLKAMNITPEFIAGFDRAGYRHLPPETLVQLKALDITPEFVRQASGGSATMPSVSELMEMKMFGRKR